MDVAFTMPDRSAERLDDRGGDLSKRALESVVADAYREEVLTLGKVREALVQFQAILFAMKSS